MRFVSDFDRQFLSLTFAPADAPAQETTIVIEGLVKLTLARIPDLSPMTAPERVAYSGCYWSDEVRVTYEVAASSNGVSFGRAGQPPATLQRLGPDKFSGPSGTVEFLREAGTVTGFRPNAGRVRIRFIKQSVTN